jgi:hypothetical protein
MRRVLFVLLAAAALGGCLSIDTMFDDRAREECDQETSPRERGECYDRVDQNRRDR